MDLTVNKVQAILSDYFIRTGEIVSAYIFGSYVKNNTSPTSDVDIALLIEESAFEKLDKLKIITDISRILKRDADVVYLNYASPLLSHEVRKHGILIFDRDPKYRKSFEVLQRKLFQDYQHIHAIYMKGFKKRYGRQKDH